ncbi:hypothetical protein D3C86_1895980 [compost metagenome]
MYKSASIALLNLRYLSGAYPSANRVSMPKKLTTKDPIFFVRRSKKVVQFLVDKSETWVILIGSPRSNLASSSAIDFE